MISDPVTGVDFILFSEFEEVFLTIKKTGQTITVGDHYGVPSAFGFSADESWCYSIGEGAIIYYLVSPFTPYRLEPFHEASNSQWWDTLRDRSFQQCALRRDVLVCRSTVKERGLRTTTDYAVHPRNRTSTEFEAPDVKTANRVFRVIKDATIVHVERHDWMLVLETLDGTTFALPDNSQLIMLEDSYPPSNDPIPTGTFSRSAPRESSSAIFSDPTRLRQATIGNMVDSARCNADGSLYLSLRSTRPEASSVSIFSPTSTPGEEGWTVNVRNERLVCPGDWLLASSDPISDDDVGRPRHM